MKPILALLILTSCSALQEAQKVGEVVVEAKGFEAAQTITAPLYSTIRMQSQRIDSIIERIQMIESKQKQLFGITEQLKPKRSPPKKVKIIQKPEKKPSKKGVLW